MSKGEEESRTEGVLIEGVTLTGLWHWLGRRDVGENVGNVKQGRTAWLHGEVVVL